MERIEIHNIHATMLLIQSVTHTRARILKALTIPILQNRRISYIYVYNILSLGHKASTSHHVPLVLLYRRLHQVYSP